MWPVMPSRWIHKNYVTSIKTGRLRWFCERIAVSNDKISVTCEHCRWRRWRTQIVWDDYSKITVKLTRARTLLCVVGSLKRRYMYMCIFNTDAQKHIARITTIILHSDMCICDWVLSMVWITNDVEQQYLHAHVHVASQGPLSNSIARLGVKHKIFLTAEPKN